MPFEWISLKDVKENIVREIIENVDFDDVKLDIDSLDLEIEYEVKIDIKDIKLNKR